MSFLKVSIALAAGFLSLSAPALAKIADFETHAVKDKKSMTLDPAKAYLLIESHEKTITTLVKLPSQAERDEWESQRQEAMVEALEKYPRELERYERRIKSYDPAYPRGRKPVKPIYPTDEDFPWPDLELQFSFMIGYQNRFSKDDGVSLYLHEVPEGDYVYYSSGLVIGGGICACLGSVSFKAEAGKVMAMWIGTEPLDASGEPIEEHPEDHHNQDRLTRTGIFVKAISDAARDPRIPSEWLAMADFTPVVGIPNWFGAEVNRVKPIPGVFAYERGEIVDLRSTGFSAEAVIVE